MALDDYQKRELTAEDLARQARHTEAAARARAINGYVLLNGLIYAPSGLAVCYLLTHREGMREAAEALVEKAGGEVWR